MEQLTQDTEIAEVTIRSRESGSERQRSPDAPCTPQNPAHDISTAVEDGARISDLDTEHWRQLALGADPAQSSQITISSLGQRVEWLIT